MSDPKPSLTTHSSTVVSPLTSTLQPNQSPKSKGEEGNMNAGPPPPTAFARIDPLASPLHPASVAHNARVLSTLATVSYVLCSSIYFLSTVEAMEHGS